MWRVLFDTIGTIHLMKYTNWVTKYTKPTPLESDMGLYKDTTQQTIYYNN